MYNLYGPTILLPAGHPARSYSSTGLIARHVQGSVPEFGDVIEYVPPGKGPVKLRVVRVSHPDPCGFTPDVPAMVTAVMP